MKIIKSLGLLERANKVIPGQTSTISKRYGRFPQGVAPAYLDYGQDCFVWDVDGNEYIDWSASLGAVIIGHNKKLLKYESCLLPLSSHIEIELAEKLVDIIPCAEMVRFFKTGSDACTSAVMLSAMINRKRIEETEYRWRSDSVVSTGYHGWHNWEHIKVDYGDLDFLETVFKLGASCYILEPMDRSCPEKFSFEYLEKVRELCTKYDVILIYDEILTGFRYDFKCDFGFAKIIPDLACYGKAMSNGYSISALVGKREIMQEMKHMRISGTYYTEPNPMLAALGTIEFIEKYKVLKYVYDIGEKLRYGIMGIINDYNLHTVCKVKGFGPWNSIEWLYPDAQQLFLQEIFRNGIFYNRDHFAMFSHTEKEVNKTLSVYREVMGFLGDCVTLGYIPEGKLVSSIDQSLFPK